MKSHRKISFLAFTCSKHMHSASGNYTFGIFSLLTSAEACEKSSWWLWKEICVSTGNWYEKAWKHVCITEHHDITLAVKEVSNLITTDQPTTILLL